jgi:dihydrofolate reductase
MGKIVLSQNITLDGVVEDPTGEEGFKHGGWFEEFMGEDRAAWAAVELDEARRAEALLLGRRTDAYFGPRWSSADGEWADRLNALPKYVVSSTLEEPKWTNVTVVKDDAVSAVTKLKREIPGDIVVYASRTLVQTLVEHDLIDEVRLVVFPVVLGSGERLFGDIVDKKPIRLVDNRSIGDGLAYLVYEFDRTT